MILAAVDRFTHYLQLAVALVWHEYYQQTNTYLSVSRQLEKRIRNVYDLDELLTEALSKTAEALEGDCGVLLLHRPETGNFEVRSSFGLPLEDFDLWEMPADRGLSGEAFRTLETQTTADTLQDPRIHPPIFEPIYQKTGARSGICVPLAHQGLGIGVMGVYSRALRQFSINEIRLAESIAGQIASAIERVRLVDALSAVNGLSTVSAGTDA